MNHFQKFREEFSFDSVKRLVEHGESHLCNQFDVDSQDLSDAEKGILSDLSWEDFERNTQNQDWVSFKYDNTTVRVWVYAVYVDEGDLKDTTVRFVLRDSDHTFEFKVHPDGRITDTH